MQLSTQNWKGRFGNLMMNKTKSALGLARKAGKCLAGSEICKKNIQNHNACMVFIDGTAGKNTRDSFEALAHKNNIPYYILDESVRLEDALGKPNAKVAVITDPNMMKLFRNIGINNNDDTHGGAEKE